MTRVTPESGPASELAQTAAELLGPAISESASDIELPPVDCGVEAAVAESESPVQPAAG